MTSCAVVGLKALSTFSFSVRVGVESRVTDAGSGVVGDLAFGIDPTGHAVTADIRALAVHTGLRVYAI